MPWLHRTNGQRVVQISHFRALVEVVDHDDGFACFPTLSAPTAATNVPADTSPGFNSARREGVDEMTIWLALAA